MDGNAYIAELIACVVLLVVGVRLLKLSLRTGGRPERLLGTYLTLNGISYALYTIPLMRDMGDLYLPLTFAGRITYAVSVYFVLAFTQSVFRSDATWSRWLVYALVSCQFAGIGGSVMIGDWEGYDIRSLWFWFEWGSYTLVSVWVAAEALHAYTSARKRAILGLCEPVVANRYLLWGMFGSMQVAASFALLWMYIDYETTHVFSSGADALVGTFEAVGTTMAWFVFFSPNFYRNWISRGTASANAEKEK
jgi:hypothetical protein